MRYVFKIILLSSLLASSLFSNTNIDECKNDLYYANGILIDMDIAIDKHEEAWKDKVDDLFLSNQEEYKKVANIKISFNASQGPLDDVYESLEQIMSNEWGWVEYAKQYRTYMEESGFQESVDLHSHDLTNQVNAYKQSIKDGHGVIVIAHSQGNYYTNEAYELLDGWMKDYFHMFGVATPANHVAGYAVGDTDAPYVKFHNDIINLILTGLDSNADDLNTEHNSLISYPAHNFYNSYMTAKYTKDKIFNFILEKIQAHETAPSQWKTLEEKDKNTENYKITVQHKFDTSIATMDDIDVFPFAQDKKLYPIDPNNPDNKQYVKASCGGTKILDEWEDKEENEVYYLEGTGEKILVYKTGIILSAICSRSTGFSMCNGPAVNEEVYMTYYKKYNPTNNFTYNIWVVYSVQLELVYSNFIIKKAEAEVGVSSYPLNTRFNIEYNFNTVYEYLINKYNKENGTNYKLKI